MGKFPQRGIIPQRHCTHALRTGMQIHTTIVTIFQPISCTNYFKSEKYFLQRLPSQKYFLEQKCVPYTIYFMTPKEKFYLKYLSSYSQKCDFRKFPPFAGKFPHGVQCLPTCNFYMYAATHPILNPVPSGS